MHAFKPGRLAQGRHAGPHSWDSQLATLMLRLFCNQHLPVHRPSFTYTRIPPHSNGFLSNRAYHSIDGMSINQNTLLDASSHVSQTSQAPSKQQPTITAFLAPPGTERHYNPQETIADSFKPIGKRSDNHNQPDSSVQNSAKSDPISPFRLITEAIETRNAHQVWHTYSRLTSRRFDDGRAPFTASTYFKILHSFQATRTKQSAKRAMIVYEDMKKYHQPKIATLNRMLDILVRHEDVNWAIQFFQEDVERFGRTLNIYSYNIMIRALAADGQILAAKKIYDDLRTGGLGSQPDISTYSTLMSHYSKNGMQEEMDKVLDEMLQDGVKPNMHIFNLIVKRFVKKSDYVGARRVLTLLKENGLKPDVITYSTLIDGYARNGDEEAIAQIQKEMAENRVYANAQTVTNTIKVFARGFLDSDVNDILEDLLKSMPPQEMNDITFGVLMNVYGKRKDLDAAMGVYNHLIAKGRAVNDVILCSLLDGHVRAGEVSTANRIFHEHFTARNIRPTTAWSYSIMIVGCCKQGNLQDALHYYHGMNSSHIAPNAIVCSRLIQLYLQHHQVDNARQMVRLMRNTKLTISLHTYTMLINYLSNTKDFRGALRYYQEMLDSGVQPDVYCYTVLINNHIRAKNYAACDNTFEQMTKSGIQPTTEAFTSIIHAHSLQGNVERVKGYWIAMTNMGLLPDLKSFTLLIQTYSQQMNVEMVEFIFKDVCQKGFKLDSILLTTLIGLYRKLPRLNVKKVDEITAMMEEFELEPLPEFFRQLLDAYGEHGMPDRVIRTWRQLQSLDKPLNWGLSTSNFLHLIEACRDRGYIDTLHSVWHSATMGTRASLRARSAQGVQGDVGDASLVGPKNSEFPQVNSYVGFGHYVRPDPEVFTAYLNALLTHNRFNEIEALLDEECQKIGINPRTEDFELLFGGLAQYDFLKKELVNIREIVVRRWPKTESIVDNIVLNTRRI
ncbi:hypothetical protein BX616_001558 [Lobosporangium transversale]|uniref:Pentacotripeptide-repeat region of PRORP domain-containing protein n=1 Tax=Lobosporangium transversale TaxID=64571 RepID=A0A1Y2GU97_9FUNG|nr:hypothetical protein BCR41DRAFT_349200 [Lobosporangium transversale]KAF9903712.1 hypothetical protein BX616_001558 [Lobosporangium transversale]ORZ23798.1 hypothetical protein BCR41DRAFT_349200 [Lobosporangium transversale]|eukprot:XP_021883612.1 hypothetical protein BCR41DRAFT_349200 [Lobosporangium transversale]